MGKCSHAFCLGGWNRSREPWSLITPFVLVDKVFVVRVFVFHFVFIQILFCLLFVAYLGVCLRVYLGVCLRVYPGVYLGVYLRLIFFMVYFLLVVLFVLFFFFLFNLIVFLVVQVVFFIICKVFVGILLLVPVRRCVVVLSLLAG